LLDVRLPSHRGANHLKIASAFGRLLQVMAVACRSLPSGSPPPIAMSSALLPLRRLVGPDPTPGAAADLLETVNGGCLHDVLLASLLDTSEQATMLTELEALTAIIRLLAVGTGDPTGDTITPDFLDPNAGKLERASLGNQINVAQVLRSQSMVHAILALLGRRSSEFERGDSVYLQLEALKALRLIMTPDGLLFVGAPHVEPLGWAQDSSTATSTSETRAGGDTHRQLVDVMIKQLQNVGDTMGQRPKIVVLGCLWSLATSSSYIRTRILQSGGEALVAKLFRAQARQPSSPQAALVAECGVLAALAAGGRTHERQMAKLSVDQDVLEMLHRFKLQRQVVCAGLVLLALLANEESISARLAASPDALAVISAARARWPEEAENALKSNVHYVSPTAAALLRGSPPASARQKVASARGGLRETTPRGGAARNRAMRAAAVCVVGRAGGG